VTSIVFELALASSEVVRLLKKGGSLKVFGFGEAPEQQKPPYAVWQRVGGTPENKLAGVPDEDTFTMQIDAYGNSEDEGRAVGIALRDAFEPAGYVISYNFEGREPITRFYRYSFTVEFMVSREVDS
jgi:hypothetical protein